MYEVIDILHYHETIGITNGILIVIQDLSFPTSATVFVILAFSFVRSFLDLEETSYSLSRHSMIKLYDCFCL